MQRPSHSDGVGNRERRIADAVVAGLVRACEQQDSSAVVARRETRCSSERERALHFVDRDRNVRIDRVAFDDYCDEELALVLAAGSRNHLLARPRSSFFVVECDRRAVEREAQRIGVPWRVAAATTAAAARGHECA